MYPVAFDSFDEEARYAFAMCAAQDKISARMLLATFPYGLPAEIVETAEETLGKPFVYSPAYDEQMRDYRREF